MKRKFNLTLMAVLIAGPLLLATPKPVEAVMQQLNVNIAPRSSLPISTCTSQINALKGTLIFEPGTEIIGTSRVMYYYYPVCQTGNYIRTDHWHGDGVFFTGSDFGPYDLVRSATECVPSSAIPLCGGGSGGTTDQ